MKKTIFNLIVLAGALVLVAVCSPGGEEPVSVLLPVVADGGGVEMVTTDLGWQVEVSTFVVALKDLQFTVEGETHAGLLQQLSDVVVPSAMAHPGHQAGGDVTGELMGTWVVDFLGDAAPLGTATLLEGIYNGVNLTLAVAAEGSGDPIAGHVAFIAGTAHKDDVAVSFEAAVDMDPLVQMVGGVFDLEVNAETEEILGLQVRTLDPFEGDTMFDGIDFGVLELDGESVAQIGGPMPEHNLLMKALQNHDHWGVVTQQ